MRWTWWWEIDQECRDCHVGLGYGISYNHLAMLLYFAVAHIPARMKENVMQVPATALTIMLSDMFKGLHKWSRCFTTDWDSWIQQTKLLDRMLWNEPRMKSYPCLENWHMWGVLAPNRSFWLGSCGSITASVTPRAVPGYLSVPQNPARQLHHGCGRAVDCWLQISFMGPEPTTQITLENGCLKLWNLGQWLNSPQQTPDVATFGLVDKER